jgi:transcriptional regulator with GAF, ATPase, and Fis domain
LNVYPIVVPPLRERGDDVIKLAKEFIKRYSKKFGINPPRLTHEAIINLSSYSWPGNVRELQNVIERGVIISKDGRLNLEKILPDNHLPTGLEEPDENEAGILSQNEILNLEKENIIRALNYTNWKVSGEKGAAKLLGIPPTTLNSRLKAFGIKRAKQKNI